MPLAVRLWGRWTGRGPEFTKGSYHLRFGMHLNIIGLLYLAFACITFNLPSVHPVTPSNMNYTCAAVGASVAIALVTWFTTGRKSFSGPDAAHMFHNGVLTALEPTSTKGSIQPGKLETDRDRKIHPE